jgi:hypothetical protein
LPFSCRKRAAMNVSKKHRSRARSGRLERRVRRPGRQRAGCLPHEPTTPAHDHAQHNGRSVGITSSTGSRSARRARSRTGLHTTPAQRAPARRRGHNAPSRCAIRRSRIKKGVAIALPRVPNDLPFSCRERATVSLSKTERSRARSGQLQRRVGPRSWPSLG